MNKLTPADVVKILTLIRANYDGAYANTSSQEAELLVRFWYDCLREYDKEVVTEAVKNAIKKCEYAPRLANIVAEADALLNADEKSDEELWAELCGVLPTVYECSRYLSYPQSYKEANDKLNELYSSLDENLKLYTVNLSSLIEISEESAESLTFEKARFFRQMPVLRKHRKEKASAQRFIEATEAQKKLNPPKK